MNTTNRSIGLMLAALVIVLAAGCQKKGNDDLAKGIKGQLKTEKKPPAPPVEKKPPPPPQKKEIPKVKLIEADAATCLVKVGDAMPEGQLPDLNGKAVSLRSLFGDKATVVLFWSNENPYARQAMRSLEKDVAKPFGAKGVRIIAVDVKETPEIARKVVEEVGATCVNLVDADGAYFAKVATGNVPRVYLLDPAGKILWFDIEYSGGRPDALRQGLEAVLQ